MKLTNKISNYQLFILILLKDFKLNNRLNPNKREEIQRALRKSLLPEIENLGSLVINSHNDEFEEIEMENRPDGIIRDSIIQKYKVHWKQNAVSCTVLNEIEDLIKDKERIEEEVQDLRSLRKKLAEMQKLENSKNRKKNKKSISYSPFLYFIFVN